jgi:hypothetical protein
MRDRLLPSSVLGQIFMPEYTNRKEQTKSNGLYNTNGIEAQSHHRSHDAFDIVSYVDEFKT